MGPFPHGRFMAYKWGVADYLLTGMILQAVTLGNEGLVEDPFLKMLWSRWWRLQYILGGFTSQPFPKFFHNIIYRYLEWFAMFVQGDTKIPFYKPIMLIHTPKTLNHTPKPIVSKNGLFTYMDCWFLFSIYHDVWGRTCFWRWQVCSAWCWGIDREGRLMRITRNGIAKQDRYSQDYQARFINIIHGNLRYPPPMPPPQEIRPY